MSTIRFLSNTTKLFAAIHVFLQYGYEIHGTFGPSMLPSLNIAGDWCLVDKFHHVHGKGMKAGDLVVASRPGAPEVFILKRIIGMPGDIILRDPKESRQEYVKVPEGHLWIVGDNLPHSTDSRHYGPIAMGLVKGKVIASVYPQWKKFESGLTNPHRSASAIGTTR